MDGADGRLFQASSTAAQQAAAMTYLAQASGHPVIQAVRAAAVDLLSVAPGSRVLDVGCGLGEMSRVFAHAVGPDGSVTAVDVNPAMVAAARDRHVSSPRDAVVSYRVADVASLYLGRDFDVVWCERVLQHVPDPDAAAGAMARSLSPGGRVCVVDADWGALAVDGAGQALTTRVLDAFRLRLRHPDIGRTLRRRLVQAGLVDPMVRSVHPITTSLADAASVIPVLDRRQAGLVAEDDRADWFDSLERADARGHLLVAMPVYVAVATERGRA
ncbi:methyltransferase domain-containing protein [Microbispora triticiradicis]|uniref:methyltransferase domain-containing protein n=1 Tax=Microbispora triticiradicis TaxID=2200763 RepID=UPI001AD63BC2|nr:methyltransferase domain-containing protein [Microbispora triticiradicis]